jgi:cytochrome c peroxidase
LWIVLALANSLISNSLFAQKMRIEFEPEWRGAVLSLNQPLRPSSTVGLSISRLDGLLSGIALQRMDGSWMESDRWYFNLSLEHQRLSAMIDGLPAQEFKRLRFTVGLPSNIDHTDPSVWPADHPLHPDLCGLHWGWKSGYVFLAIEGHFDAPAGQPNGFSYHLAHADPPMTVELPIRFSGASAHTLRIGFDLATLLAEGSILSKGLATHSRENDPLAAQLKEKVPGSFRILSLKPDLFQAIRPDPKLAFQKTKVGTPLQLEISERLPQVSLPVDNPLTVEGVQLGRRLFQDGRLSKDGSQSCASCHVQEKGFTDGRALSVGVENRLGRRNTMPLINLAWGSAFFWDGRAASLREQVLLPIQDPKEMNESMDSVLSKLSADTSYVEQFKCAFGADGITAARLGLSLEQFLLTLVSQNSKFDRAARGLESLSTEEQLGLQLFVTEFDPRRGLRGADCFHCHGGNLFTNHRFADNGLPERGNDPGRFAVTGVASDRGKFKVPTLRNVGLTGPYMHDGRFTTLEEVVEHYNSGVQRHPNLDPNLAKHPESGMELTTPEKRALVSFLQSLSEREMPGPSSSHLKIPVPPH